MISTILSDSFPFRFHVQKVPMGTSDEKWYLCQWLCENSVVAQIEIHSEKKIFDRFTLFQPKLPSNLLPRLTECVMKILRKELELSPIEVIPLSGGLERFFSDKLSRRKTLLEWFKNGGDPKNLLYAAVYDENILRIYLEKGGDPHVDINSDGFIFPLIYFAVKTKSLEIVKLLIEKKVNVNRPIVTVKGDKCSILNYSIAFESIEMVELLLQSGALFIGKESINFVVKKITNWKQVVELIAKYHSISEIANKISLIGGYTEEELNFLFSCISKHHKITVPITHMTSNLLESMAICSLLGHQFGLPLNLDLDIGLEHPFSYSTEGISINGTNFPKAIHSSVSHFFKICALPQFSSTETLSLLQDFEASEKALDPIQASLLIKKFNNNEITLLDGKWSHHCTYIVLDKKHGLIFLCDRGNTSGSLPGIHVFRLQNPEKITVEILLKMETSSDPFLVKEEREKCGLVTEPFDLIRRRQQPGDFCAWNNRKLAFELLLALSQMPEVCEEENLKSTLRNCFNKTRQIYNTWSTFDKHNAISKAIEFYSLNPHLKPPISLFLFILATFDGQIDSLFSFLKDKVTLKDFKVKDLNGKSLLHHLSKADNLTLLLQLATSTTDKGAFWDLFDSELNTAGKPPCFSITPLERAVDRDKHDVALALIMNKAKISPQAFDLILLMVSTLGLPEIIKAYKKIGGISFEQPDSYGRTGLHYAIQRKTHTIIELFLTEYQKDFIKTRQDVEQYLIYAQDYQSERAIALLTKIQEGWNEN